MNDPAAGPLQTPHRKRRRRLWILIGGLIALSTVHVLSGLDLGFLPHILHGGGAGPLEPWITHQGVLDALDGKTAFTLPKDAGGGGIESITLRKVQITSLSMRASDSDTIHLRFYLDHDRKRYLVEGSLGTVHNTGDMGFIDNHVYGDFEGRAVPSR